MANLAKPNKCEYKRRTSSQFSHRITSGIDNDCVFVLTDSTRTPFPRFSVNLVAGVLVGMITWIVIALLVRVLVDTIVGLGIAFGGETIGRITGPKTAFGGAISGEKIMPLRVILLVPAILLMSELTFSELESSAAD